MLRLQWAWKVDLQVKSLLCQILLDLWQVTIVILIFLSVQWALLRIIEIMNNNIVRISAQYQGL